MPSSPSRQAELAALIARPFAHRGLHGPGRIENSRAAFEAAVANGFGIELDVQASRDGRAIVFHDSDLERLTGQRGAVEDLTVESLGRLQLRDSDEKIPTLEEILRLVSGRVPLLIEVKAPGRRATTINRATRAALTGYSGSVAVMSFNPEVSRWFARTDPDRLRGLVITENGRRWRSAPRRRLALWRARPDFLAYDIRDLPAPFATAQRRAGRAILTWTCRSADERQRAALHADQIIFEQPA
jgi:glycerophosphoryl diester phosphodiesterase